MNIFERVTLLKSIRLKKIDRRMHHFFYYYNILGSAQIFKVYYLNEKYTLQETALFPLVLTKKAVAAPNP